MSVYRRGKVYWYKFYFEGRLLRESAKTELKTLAKKAEEQRRRELEEGYNNLRGDTRGRRIRTVSEVAEEYLADYELRHRSVVFMRYAVGHLVRILASQMLVDITDDVVKAYQSARLREGAAPKTINEEVGVLLRLLGDAGDALRCRMRRDKTLKLAVRHTAGKAFSGGDKAELFAAAERAKSPYIRAALVLALKLAMRSAEIRNVRIQDIDWAAAPPMLTVAKSKTAAGEGRGIPLRPDVQDVLATYLKWYVSRFGSADPTWFLFPFGKSGKLDPTRPVTTLKTAWKNIRASAGVRGRWHDARHTRVTELLEGGASEATVMQIAGHVSKQAVRRYSHIRVQAMDDALAKADEAAAAKLKREQKR